ncbi:MAG: efflux transporter outer membrane subunit [Paucibacter sp.]|nr:efflux transporter outer membrane subunit [Roseateles sp.]
MTSVSLASSLLIALLLGGCAITRVDPPAPVKAPEQFKEDALWQRAKAAEPAPEAWWELFKDPVLDDLEKRLVIGNENLKATAAQVASAQATVAASHAAMLPTLSTSLSGTRNRNATSGNGGTAVAGGSNPSNSVDLGLTAGWEVDLWGRLSQAASAAEASYQASRGDLAAARLSAQSLLAQTYFSLRSSELQSDLLDRSVAAYQRSLDLTQARFDSGVAARSDVLQAETQLDATRAQALEAKSQRATYEHALAVLLGVPPSSFALPAAKALPAAPALPEFLPATLLERRPDIGAARARVVAAYLQIGVADAAYFPQIDLTGSGGWRHSSFNQLVSAPNLVWSLGASLTEAILDSGQRQLASAQARASADAATATYRQTVLTALQEVEDNLVQANHLATEETLQDQARKAAASNLDLTLDQYRAGTVSYLNVVTAQTALLSAEQSLLDVQNRRLAALDTLLKNIAGRW